MTDIRYAKYGGNDTAFGHHKKPDIREGIAELLRPNIDRILNNYGGYDADCMGGD